MLNSCGYTAYKPGVSLWFVSQLTHSCSNEASQSYGKLFSFTHKNTQLHTFLYTIYAQYFTEFVSVIKQLVHIIHIAYKEHNELNKGTL